MSDEETPPPAEPPTVTISPVVSDITQSMQGQASGMIALDVESFSNGFMQIMLAGIGWASAEIASTEGAKGEEELTFFTTKLSTDLPQIIQNITLASKGEYTPGTPPSPPAKDAVQQKRGMFSR